MMRITCVWRWVFKVVNDTIMTGLKNSRSMMMEILNFLNMCQQLINGRPRSFFSFGNSFEEVRTNSILKRKMISFLLYLSVC